MPNTKKKSGMGLMAEGVKKTARSAVRAAKAAVGVKAGSRKSALGTMSEGAKKTGRGVARAVKSVGGSRSQGGNSRGR